VSWRERSGETGCGKRDTCESEDRRCAVISLRFGGSRLEGFTHFYFRERWAEPVTFVFVRVLLYALRRNDCHSLVEMARMYIID